jgi:two-component system sensor histidine kinase FlrB
MGRMMSSLAHQIRTPLSAAMLYAGHLSERELNSEQIRRFSLKIVDRLSHLERQVKDMLIFVRGDVKLTDSLSCAELLAALRPALEAPLTAAAARCRLSNDCPEALLHCNRDSVVGALMNLVNNGLQAAGRGAELVIDCRRDERWISIAVSDDGPGFDAEVAGHLNEPFFTTKAQGTGLGLAVVRAVAEAHHGDFAIAARPGRGATATLRLPIWSGGGIVMNEAMNEALS